MRRGTLILFLLLVAAVASPAAPGLAQTSQPAPAQQGAGVRADFNQDGFADLAVGVPGEDVGSLVDAGAVNVLYGTPSGLRGTNSQQFTQVGGAVEAVDSFGYALAAGDFNRDGYADLAAGAPWESVGSLGEAGAVSILYGSAAGLTTTGGRLFIQVGGAVERDDFFGGALAAGDFNHDGFTDLAASAFNEDLGSIGRAGAVSILYGSAAGLTTTGARLFTQDSPGIPGGAEPYDRFGRALTEGDFNHDNFADLAVGAPWDIAVTILYGSAAGLTATNAQRFTQPGGGWALAAGDFNHDGFAELAAGAPEEAVGNIQGAGVVSILYGSAAGLTTAGGRLFSQVGGVAEVDDQFGYALAAGDFNNNGFADLAVGAPFEDAGSLYSAGAVSILYGSAGGLTATGGRLLTQVGGVAETGDWFGRALAAGNFDKDGFADLAVGAPGEGVGSLSYAGAVSVLYGSAGGLATTRGRLFTQNSPGVPDTAEAQDDFGSALTAGGLGASPATASTPGASPTARPTAQNR